MRARNRAHMVTQAILGGILKIGPAPSNRLCPECLFQPLTANDDIERRFAIPGLN
jgi:hypothetical protein